jgi:hypothetical protein
VFGPRNLYFLISCSQGRPARINTISIELLALIFHFAKDDPEHESDPIRVYDQNLFVSSLSAVCGHWRRTAIGDGTLWRNISFSPSILPTVNCATEFLRRSRRASLFLMMWNPDSPDTPGIVENPAVTHFINQIGQSVDRITELVAINPPETVIGVLTQPATRLVRLDIRSANTAILPSLFGGIMPKLENLSISSPIGWKIQFQNLNILRLSTDSSIRWRLSGFLDCIDATVSIKELHLTSFECFTPENATESRRIVTLSSLCVLRLAFCDSARILGHLDIPLDAAVSIYGHNSHSEDILTYLPKSPRFLRTLKTAQFLTVIFDVERQIFEVDIFGEGINLLLGAIPWHEELDRKWVLRSMAAVTRFTPISSVKWLTVAVDEYRMPWKVWLSKFDLISTLEVRCPDPAELLGALAGAGRNTERILCRALRSLSVERSQRPTADPSLLRECLETRASAGSAISDLNLDNLDWTAIQPTELEAWEELIRRTRLDGTWFLPWIP